MEHANARCRRSKRDIIVIAINVKVSSRDRHVSIVGFAWHCSRRAQAHRAKLSLLLVMTRAAVRGSANAASLTRPCELRSIPGRMQTHSRRALVSSVDNLTKSPPAPVVIVISTPTQAGSRTANRKLEEMQFY